ncbi:TIGR03790 family protein, partial [bacterium]|nr:TIGR03790 family protein [bacterium]
MFNVFFCLDAFALEPDEVLVVANLNVLKSKTLAQYYMSRRKIPKKNLVLLSLTGNETCSRDEYTKKAIPPIQRFLHQNNHIRAIVTMFGIPLRINSPGRSESEKIKLQQLEIQKQNLKIQLFQNQTSDLNPKQEISSELSNIKKNIADYKRRIDKVSSFDSELSLVKKQNYSLNMWIPNPYYLGFKNQDNDIKRSEVLMTSRLDGASPEVVKRIINDSIEAEKEGLKGSAYFDARWKNPGDEKEVTGYTFYDKSIHATSQDLIIENEINVVLNDEKTLFQKGDCPDAAIYCGWYSLA